jgi:hypothetical protein
MRIWGVVLLAGILGVSGGVVSAETRSVAEVMQQAQAVSVDRQPELYIRAAEENLKASTKLYDDGQVDQARNMLNDLVTYSDKAAEAATRSHKRVKNTEIELRKITEKLLDLKRTLNFEDQAPVQAAMDHLESLRTSLLSLMFGKEKK